MLLLVLRRYLKFALHVHSASQLPFPASLSLQSSATLGSRQALTGQSKLDRASQLSSRTLDRKALHVAERARGYHSDEDDGNSSSSEGLMSDATEARVVAVELLPRARPAVEVATMANDRSKHRASERNSPAIPVTRVSTIHNSVKDTSLVDLGSGLKRGLDGRLPLMVVKPKRRKSTWGQLRRLQVRVLCVHSAPVLVLV